MSARPDISALLGDEGGGEDEKPSIGEALGDVPEDADKSGTDVTREAKVETGNKLLQAFEAKDPAALYDAVCSVMQLEGSY